MMNDLDTLRPEVREAVNRTDVTVEMFDTLVTVNRDDYDIIRTELRRLAHVNSHLLIAANEYQDRAERAEAELAAIKAEMDQLRADAETGKAWRTDSSLEEWFPITAAELKHVKTELAAIKARIAGSDAGIVTQTFSHLGSDGADTTTVEAYPPKVFHHTAIGQRVRLVMEE